MPLTYVVDTPTASLTSNGLSETAAITLARLVCDTTVGADDLTSTNAQNNFVQELVAAVGPAIAFNAICRQLVKINNTVAHPYSGTVYSQISEDTYKNYLDSYIMRDSFDNIDVTSEQTTSFIPEQWQTLAAFANAGLSLETMLAVADYNIIMLFLTRPESELVGNGSGGLATLCVNFSLSNNTPSSTFLKYGSNDNLKTAKHRYAISTLAQNGTPAFSDSVSADHIVAGLLADPVYANSTPSAAKLYGLIASLSVVTSQTHPIRSSYGNLIKPVQYALSGSDKNDLKKRPKTQASGSNPSPAYISAHITLSVLSDYSKLLSTNVQNIYYYKTVDNNGAGQSAQEVAGTPFDPTTKQFITVSSLQGQSAQDIYASLNFTSSNSVSTDVANELAAFKLYGKTIPQIRAVVDSTGAGITSYNNIEYLRTAGYSNTEITNAFSSTTYEFAVLIGVCSIVANTSGTGNKLKYEAVTGNYDFKYVAADAIKSSIVNKLRAIVTADQTDSVIGITTSGKAANKLHNDMRSCLNDFVTSNITTYLNAANAEPAILRFLHSSAAMFASDTGAASLDAFTAYNGLDNMYPFMNLKYTLAASPSSLAPTAFLKLSEFAKYTEGEGLSYGIDSTSSNSATYNKVKSLVSAGSSPKSRQSFDNYSNSANNLPNKQFYVLGAFEKHYYRGNASQSAKSFDNGYSVVDAYPYMATSTASKIDNIDSQGWPEELAFSHTSMLLADVCTHIMKKMNTSHPTPISDDALANSTYPTDVWTSFTKLLVGPQKTNSIDNISYKSLIRAGATAQYIKVDLAKNIASEFTSIDATTVNSVTTTSAAANKASEFALLGLPFADALFVARKADSTPFTVKDIVANTKFSRFERRKIFDNVQQAAQQLDKSTFLGLVWQYADLEANIKGQNPLNIQLVDLLSLTYSAQEADADGYLNTAASRLAYHDAVVRKNMVKLFYPNLSEADVAVIASLNNVDEILDELSSRSLV